MLDSVQATETLRAAGLRLTPQRRAVIEALVGNRTHPTAEDVADLVGSKLPGVSMSTIYNTLHELAQAGLVQEIRTAGSLRFDPEIVEHAHVVCPACETVRDLDIGETLLKALSKAAGGPIASVSIAAQCRSCGSKTESP